MSDGSVVGSHESPNAVNIDVELPGYGPGVLALRVSSAASVQGKKRVVVGNQLTHVADPEYIARIQRRKSAWTKTKTVLLLTDDEMNEFFGTIPP